MKRLLSIAVLAIGMSASLAHSQEVKADKQDANYLTALDSQTSAQQSTIAEPNAVTAKESFVQKALSVGGSLHARIDHTKDTLKSSFTGGLKEKFENAGITIDYFKCDLDEPDVNDIEFISKEKARQAYEKLGSPVFVADSGFYIET